MNCKKCGAEIGKGDVFCGSCGKKVTAEEPTFKPDKKKKIIIGAACTLAVIVLAIIVLLLLPPKEMNVEAGELAKVLYSEDENAIEEYRGVTLHVHGYLNRDTGGEEYALYTNENDGYVVTFTSEEPIDEEVGNESELVVTGEIVLVSEELSFWELEAVEIDVKDKVDRVYTVDSVGELIKDYDKYLKKEVTVTGIVKALDSNKIVIADIDREDKNIKLSGLSKTQTAKIALAYGTYRVTGKFNIKEDRAYIDVRDIELLMELDNPEENSEESSSDTSVTEFVGVYELKTAGLENYVGKMVSLCDLMLMDTEFGMPLLYDEVNDETMYLDGASEEDADYYNGEYVTVVGTVERGGEFGYYISIYSIW